ncbi:DUF3515 domain-containing protein [Streptomyces sp. MP131-18]|uniref:DUF3515 domain-containing protein n=1 Tax=Streptomyces sp. MP131-18 TaxID=1857892 RepID=UPI00097CA1E4|nr:DUF3515 domain-containing protein [Streptomyces sp. MP131-18]
MSSTVRRVPPVVCAVLIATACTSADQGPRIEPPTPVGEAADACRALTADLPERVDGAERGEPDRESPFTAVWGDPAIVLRCGVDEPQVLTPGSETYDPVGAEFVGVNEVSWLLEEESGGARFTTVEREVFVEMTVPDSYAPEVNPLLDVATAIDGHIPLEALYADPE